MTDLGNDVAAATTGHLAPGGKTLNPSASAKDRMALPKSNGTGGARTSSGNHSFSGDSGIALDETDDSQSDQERRRGAGSPLKDRSHEIPLSGHENTARGPQTRANAKIRTYSDDPDTKKFPRISRPVELMRNEYDVVVIGSGYGGGVAASRMARAGQSVCLLERGKEKWPGEYPSGFVDAMKQLHVSGDFAPGFLKGSLVECGDPTGLYHLIVGQGQNAFVGNGLGGTSLLNANIFLEADNGTMGMDSWPRDLRKPDTLKPYYDRAASVLQPSPYPMDWPELPKLSLLEKQQKALGMGRFYRPPQTTRFEGGPNSTGVEMYPSALTGMDSTGINDGSKSSTLVNYLSDAWNWGAEMFCECEVRYIKKNPDPEQGYLIFFAWHGSNRGAFKQYIYEDLMWVRAKKCVFVGAGSIGTTEILLRSKKLGMSMSDKVGIGMSGNGDMLAFGYNTNDEVNAIGRQRPSPYKPIGPTITGIIDCREGHKNPLDGFVIEEGAVPKALAPLFQSMLQTMPGKQSPPLTFAARIQHTLASVGSRVFGPYYAKGSIEKTQVYLVMSHDSNQAILSLKKDQPVLEFMGVGRSEHVTYLNGLLKKATEAVGGTFINSPFYAVLGKQEITVHPIGGACMSNDGTGEGGATSQYGEVFSGLGDETHEGLFVTDGAVIPTALGVNPLATITALAERTVEYAAAKRVRADINLEQKNAILNLFGKPGQFEDDFALIERVNTIGIATATEEVETTEAAEANGIGFSEVMTGYIHVGDGIEGDKIEDFETAAKTAEGLCEQARFFLSVKAWDTMLSKLYEFLFAPRSLCHFS
jgi:choline dehydrogenase-like flavoprotein